MIFIVRTCVPNDLYLCAIVYRYIVKCNDPGNAITASRQYDQFTVNRHMQATMPGKRHSYTSKFKLEVVKFAEEHGGNRAAGREFGINETQ
jgi:hypothetical protein